MVCREVLGQVRGGTFHGVENEAFSPGKLLDARFEAGLLVMVFAAWQQDGRELATVVLLWITDRTDYNYQCQKLTISTSL
jgi:hypothetical protein